MKNKIQLLLNPVACSFACVSMFVNAGMKDDTIQGISHLAEHFIIENLMQKYPELFCNNRIDAYVDKEYTCVYAIVLKENVNVVLKTFSQLFNFMYFESSNDIIEKQKKIIYEIENERVLANARLINVLLLEQSAFSTEVRNPTIVYPIFNNINETLVKNFCTTTYLSASKYLVVSGDFSVEEIEKLLYQKNSFLSSSNSCAFKQKTVDNSIPTDRFDDVNDIRKTIAIRISDLENIIEYYSIYIVCMLYKILINNKLKNTDFFVQDISFKLYSEGTILFFTYNKFFEDTFSFFKSFDIGNCEEMFLNIKKHFLFSYLQKSCDFLGFNKEIYKVFRFFGIKLNNENIVKYIQKVKYCNVVSIHQKIKNGQYHFVKEDATCGCV